MMSLSDDKQADIIDAFNTKPRYLDDLLNINNVHCDNMVSTFRECSGSVVGWLTRDREDADPSLTGVTAL